MERKNIFLFFKGGYKKIECNCVQTQIGIKSGYKTGTGGTKEDE
jgi:hypothetical protein